MIECPDCDGKGMIYSAFDTRDRVFKVVTELAYTILPPDEDIAKSLGMRWCQGGVDRCDTCYGEGAIPDNY